MYKLCLALQRKVVKYLNTNFFFNVSSKTVLSALALLMKVVDKIMDRLSLLIQHRKASSSFQRNIV